MATDPVLFDVADGVATITLNDPDTRNALSPEMLGGLIEAFERAREDDPGTGPHEGCRRGAPPPARSHDHKRPGLGQLRPGEGVSLEEAPEVLARLEGAHGEQVLAGDPEALEQGRAPGDVGLGEVVGTLAHDHEPVGGDADACGEDGLGGLLGGDDDDGRPGRGPS